MALLAAATHCCSRLSPSLCRAGELLVSTRKFMLGPSEPCALRFGPDGRFSDEVERFEACGVPGPGVSMPSDGKACWAWCDGAMSQAYSATSLLQVRSFKPVRGGAGLYKRRSRKGNGT